MLRCTTTSLAVASIISANKKPIRGIRGVGASANEKRPKGKEHSRKRRERLSCFAGRRAFAMLFSIGGRLNFRGTAACHQEDSLGAPMDSNSIVLRGNRERTLFCQIGTVITVEARQFRGEPLKGVHLNPNNGRAFVINSAREAIAVYPGDWIVTDVDHWAYYPIEDREFRSKYEHLAKSTESDA
jgi:hypothetical protein